MTRAVSQRIAALVLAVVLVAGCAEAAAPIVATEPDAIPALETRRQGRPEITVLTPTDGATVTSPLKVDVAVENFELAPKGVSRDGEGHFHVIEGECIHPGEVIADEHAHVGNGTASTQVELEPGMRQLCVQLGDGFHTALAISQTIEVFVEG